jgi:hypothetical protein
VKAHVTRQVLGGAQGMHGHAHVRSAYCHETSAYGGCVRQATISKQWYMSTSKGTERARRVRVHEDTS